MTNKLTKEWFLEAPWGRIAMIGWGQAQNPPILLAHGWIDSAATFIPLVELLPDTYHYVSFDFPGHGKSDPVYSGPPVSQSVMVETIRLIVEQMQWKSFVYLTHSFGYLSGIIYNQLYPGRIKKMINIDSRLSITNYYYASDDWNRHFLRFYEYYYRQFDEYSSLAKPKPPTTYERLIEAVMASRRLTKEQAEVVLSRSIVPAGNDKYRLTTQPVMRNIVICPIPEDTLREIIFSPTTPPSLNFRATTPIKLAPESVEFFYKFDYDSKHPHITIEGTHDVHITNPELLVPHIIEFLDKPEIFSAKL